MSEVYGVTPSGVNIKRLDTILDEFHTDLSQEWEFNTRQNPQSFLTVLSTDFLDKIAELWEFGQEIYYSLYPYSAERLSLDNAVQFGGISRESAKPSYYPIHCECLDGTVIPKGLLIKSNTNPETNFVANAATTVERSAFSRVKISVVAVEPNTIYSLAVDGNIYSYTSGNSPTETEIINGLAAAIHYPATENKSGLTVTAEGTDVLLSGDDPKDVYSLVLGSNLTTASVTGIVVFASQELGDIELPNDSITQIAQVIPGLLAVNNITDYIKGNLEETDTQLRASYADKIFNRASGMRESIKSSILQQVQGTTTCVVYENDTDEYDSEGRPPHSVEVVVDGGDEMQIAQVIWDKKAAGINTFGKDSADIIAEGGESVTVRFNRPEYVYVWFSVNVWLNTSEPLPTNYVDLIKASILSQMSKLNSGVNIVQQKFLADIYKTVPGIGYLEIPVWYTTDQTAQPPDYPENVIDIEARQKAVTDEPRIEVILNE